MRLWDWITGKSRCPECGKANDHRHLSSYADEVKKLSLQGYWRLGLEPDEPRCFQTPGVHAPGCRLHADARPEPEEQVVHVREWEPPDEEQIEMYAFGQEEPVETFTSIGNRLLSTEETRVELARCIEGPECDSYVHKAGCVYHPRLRAPEGGS